MPQRLALRQAKSLALNLLPDVLTPLSVLKQAAKRVRKVGVGQLSLIEHALYPLAQLKNEDLTHSSSYRYSGPNRKRKSARVRVLSPLGLAPNDELYLWGLLSLTLSQPKPTSSLVATPHWCLKQLGFIDEKTRRGGRQYLRFAEALRRLSVVNYLSDACYDPSRKEYRKMSFGFFSYSLPMNPKSTRAWTIQWDRIFFELVKTKGGSMRFDFDQYCKFDAATRRLFLFVLKIAYRRGKFPVMDLRQLAVELLGLSSSLSVRDMKVKVVRTLKRLEAADVVQNSSVTRTKPGVFSVCFERGAYLENPISFEMNLSPVDSPLLDGLLEIGFKPSPAIRIIRRYPAPLVSQWTDVTLAAVEKFGMKYFKVSPMAFFMDAIKNASLGTRTPPDWWHQFKKAEARHAEVKPEANQVFSRLIAEVFGETSVPDNKKKKNTPEHVSELLRKINR